MRARVKAGAIRRLVQWLRGKTGVAMEVQKNGQIKDKSWK